MFGYFAILLHVGHTVVHGPLGSWSCLSNHIIFIYHIPWACECLEFLLASTLQNKALTPIKSGVIWVLGSYFSIYHSFISYFENFRKREHDRQIARLLPMFEATTHPRWLVWRSHVLASWPQDKRSPEGMFMEKVVVPLGWYPQQSTPCTPYISLHNGYLLGISLGGGF